MPLTDTKAANPPQVLLPIHLDRWRHPIASKLREVAARLPDVQFSSFSSPETPEDLRLAPGLWSLANIQRIGLASLVARRFDIVYHASATPANIAASLLAKARGMGRPRHIFTASVGPRDDDPYAGSVRFAITFADHVLAVSMAAAEVVELRFGRKVECIVPNGVDVDVFSPGRAGPVAAYGLSPGYALFVGAMIPSKQPECILELAAQMPQADFVMVGRVGSSSFARRLMREITHAPNVTHLGFVERTAVRDLLNGASVLVHPSELEGMSNAVLEATAMGIPVVARPLPEMDELVVDRVTGWLIAYDGPEGWVRQIASIMAWDKQTREAFGEGSRQWVRAHFTWDAAAEKLGAFFASVRA